MEIDIRTNIRDKAVLIYTPNNDLLLETNDDKIFNDIRCQIKEKSLSGYYIIFENQRIQIYPNGLLENYPTNLFGISRCQLNYLYDIDKNYNQFYK